MNYSYVALVTVMKLHAITLTFALALSSPIQADEIDRIETWKRHFAEMYTRELSGSWHAKYFAPDGTETERTKLIAQFSTELATCYAIRIGQLADSKSIPIEKILVDPDSYVLQDDQFTSEEWNGAMKGCVANAFRNAGLEY